MDESLMLSLFRCSTQDHTEHFWALTHALLFSFWRKGLLGSVPDTDIPHIAFAAIFHDIGKGALLRDIFEKPAGLKPLEKKIMQMHPSMGALILESIVPTEFQRGRLYQYGREICLHHHERWDGAGYPDGLTGDAIAPYIQVIGLADAYDALRANRPYRPGLSHNEAVQLISCGKCGQFAPQLLEHFLSVIDLAEDDIYNPSSKAYRSGKSSQQALAE